MPANSTDIPSRPDPKWSRFYDKLVEERDRLIDGVNHLTEQGREMAPDPLKNSLAEVGTETFHRDQLLGAAAANQRRLAEINRAIAKIHDGTYGVCEATGKPIPEARLEAVPWARFTVEVEQELEARGEVPATSIGELGSTGTSRPGTTADIVNQQ